MISSSFILAATLSAALGMSQTASLTGERLLEMPALNPGDNSLRAAVLANAEQAAGGLEPSREAPPPSGLVRAHDILKPLTAGSLLLTVALGTLVAINYPTIFGEGRCTGPSPVFGTYGCDALNIDHGISAVLSVTLYTATSVLELTPEVRAVPLRYPLAQRYLRYVHLAGIVLQPLLGIIASYPQIIGISPGDQPEFSKVMRSIHVFAGYLTFSAYATSTILEF